MAATELTRPVTGRRLSRRAWPSCPVRGGLISALVAVWLLTAAGAALGVLAPSLRPGGHPHPTLHGSVGDAVAIFATNLRLLSVPFALVLLGFHSSRRTRVFADPILGALLTLNTVRVGLALGHFGIRLIPYVPQLPLEWLALALSANAWIAARRDAPHSWLRARALETALTAAAAATVETLLTPHLR